MIDSTGDRRGFRIGRSGGKTTTVIVKKQHFCNVCDRLLLPDPCKNGSAWRCPIHGVMMVVIDNRKAGKQ